MEYYISSELERIIINELLRIQPYTFTPLKLSFQCTKTICEPIPVAVQRQMLPPLVFNAITRLSKKFMALKRLKAENKAIFANSYDLYSSEYCVLAPGARRTVSTGVAIGLPEGCYGRIASRSGLAAEGIDVMGGVVDPCYTGEIKVILKNDSSEAFVVSMGSRIAQLICELILSPRIRGFGSTGN